MVGIRYDEKTAGAIVDMEISLDFAQFSEDTTASILTAGLLGEKYIGLMTGGDPSNLEDGDIIFDTQSAVVLEELIGKFLLNMGSDK
ncbi:MAG: putative phospholipid ABC transporter-binding protein MlaD [Gammaproteobacteria bacterium]|nr:MAG: putative phospholipid ABC transporter-binding protein MlaD [Gammaproteobacteria bacterium]